MPIEMNTLPERYQTTKVREVGEGVPRMFEVMEGNGLHKPEFADKPHGFTTVSLRNSMVWDEETRIWLAKFKELALSTNQPGQSFGIA